MADEHIANIVIIFILKWLKPIMLTEPIVYRFCDTDIKMVWHLFWNQVFKLV